MPENNAPVEKFRLGAVSIAIFINHGSKGTFPTAHIENQYQKEEGGPWKNTENYSLRELAALKAIIDPAIATCLKIEKERKKEQQQNQPPPGEGLEKAA